MAQTVTDPLLLESCVRDELNVTAPRYFWNSQLDAVILWLFSVVVWFSHCCVKSSGNINEISVQFCCNIYCSFPKNSLPLVVSSVWHHQILGLQNAIFSTVLFYDIVVYCFEFLTKMRKAIILMMLLFKVTFLLILKLNGTLFVI